MKYFYRGNEKPHSGFCFFSSRLKALQHFYIQNVDELCDALEKDTWSLDKASLHALENFLTAYDKTIGLGDCGPDLIEIDLDQKFND